MITDCQGLPYPVFAQGFVSGCKAVMGAEPYGSVYLLSVVIPAGLEGDIQIPAPGQFYMLHALRSDTLLARPISVYHIDKSFFGETEIQFLILVKGNGTQELCSLQDGDKINILGPCGNRFPCPLSETKKVCIVGGGIGVAPVAGFAETLSPKTYDFYASFKSGCYGLEHIKPEKLVVTTDDGSRGIKGMLPAALTEQSLRDGNYSAVYACGPLPMLAYVKQIAEAANIPCYLSMEARMACGVGVCLGCTITTTEGKKRCCKDGPIFDGNILVFEAPKKNPLDSIAAI